MIKRSVLSRISVLALAGLMVFGLFGMTHDARALTQAEANAICSIVSCNTTQRAALQALVTTGAGTTGTPLFFNFGTTTLRQGSRGIAVQNVQSFLNQTANAGLTVDGAYGPRTRAAVARWQAANLLSADGVFGPISRTAALLIVERMNANNVGQQPDDDDDDDDGTPGALSGGAGSIESYSLLSRYSNEEIGEGQEDVRVAALEIEADEGSDLRISAVRLAFAVGTATNDDFEDYADEVSLWLGDNEVGRIDSDWSGTIVLDNDAIIERGETEILYVAVSGLNNIDSAELGDTWTVDFRSIRWQDAQGAMITEDPGTAPVTFSFESFATASGAELRISEADEDINRARVINIDATDDTDDVELLSFTMEARGDSDITIESIPIRFDVTGATDVGAVIGTVYLLMDGDEIGSENVGTGLGTDEVIVFDDLDFTIDAGDEMEFTVTADFFSLADDIDEGDTIAARLTEDETDLSTFDAEDEQGDSLSDADITGQATGDAHALYDAGITVSFDSATATAQSISGADNDSGTFTIRFEVEAFDGTIFISDTAVATTDEIEDLAATATGDGIIYAVEQGGAEVTGGLSDLVTFSSSGGASASAGGNIRLDEGESAMITLTINRTNATTGDSGIYQAMLRAIGWNTDDSTTYNLYTFDLQDFDTDPITLN